MKTIKVSRFDLSSVYPSLAEISARMDTLGKGHVINVVNWEKFSYKPYVRFNIAYSDNELFLKYYVRESCVKAEKEKDNQMVCEDSCVEFFVSPADDGIYYNFEVNPIGTLLLGSGHGREDTARADISHLNDIRRLTTMGNTPFDEIKGDIQWSVTLAIPLKAFFRHEIGNLKGKTFRANFYKCGDKLSMPHYITWNAVKTERPDYHRPEYFGYLKFI